MEEAEVQHTLAVAVDKVFAGRANEPLLQVLAEEAADKANSFDGPGEDEHHAAQ